MEGRVSNLSNSGKLLEQFLGGRGEFSASREVVFEKHLGRLKKEYNHFEPLWYGGGNVGTENIRNQSQRGTQKNS